MCACSVASSFLTLCDPMDCQAPESDGHGLQLINRVPEPPGKPYSRFTYRLVNRDSKYLFYLLRA